MTNMLDFEFAVQRLVDLGYPRETAEHHVRMDLPHLAPPTPTEPTRDDRVPEKAEQVEIRKLLIAYGFEVYSLSQPRATKQSPGLPDVYAIHRAKPIALWVECKRQRGGRVSPPQRDFQELATRAGVLIVIGDRHAVADKLVEINLAIRGAGPLGIIPVRDAVPSH